MSDESDQIGPPAPAPAPAPSPYETTAWSKGTRDLAQSVQSLYGMPSIELDFEIEPTIQSFLAKTDIETLTPWKLGTKGGSDVGLFSAVAGALNPFAGDDDGGDSLNGNLGDFESRIVKLLPEELRYEEVMDEIWLLPLVAAIARGDENEGIRINGVMFGGADVAQAQELHVEESNRLHAGMVQQIVGESVVDSETGEPIEVDAASRLATDVVNRMLSDTTINIQIHPGLEPAASKMTLAASEINLEMDAETGELVSSDERIASGGPGTFGENINEDGSVSINNQPLLTSQGVEQLFRMEMMDWDQLVESSFERDPETGRPGTAVDVRLGEFGANPMSGAEEGLPSVDYDPLTSNVKVRNYSAASATTVLYSMAPKEIGHLQDKLVRAGYLTEGEMGIRRNDPTDERTMFAWKSALGDALKTRQSVDMLLRDRVSNSPYAGRVNSLADDWAQDRLGRNLRPGEQTMLKKYVTDWDRPMVGGPDQGIDFGSQVEGYLDREFGDESQLRAGQDQAMTVEGIARAMLQQRGKDS